MGRVLYSQGGTQSDDTVSTKCVTSKSKETRSEGFFGRIIFGIATLFVCIGLIWFAFLNHNRYEDLVGKVKHINVIVQGVTKQTDVEQYENAEAEIERYHLTAQYNGKGFTRDIVLKEGYIDEEQAKSFIGAKRYIAIDTSSWQNVVDKGISYKCGIPVCFGFICYIILGIVILRRRK